MENFHIELETIKQSLQICEKKKYIYIYINLKTRKTKQ